MHLHSLYGLNVASARELPAPLASAQKPDLTITETHARLTSNSYINGFSYRVCDDRSVHVSWSDLFDFTVDAEGKCIAVHAEPEWHHEPVYTYLIGQVLSVALLQRSIESLHATAFVLDGRAFAVLGNCGAGKSTLAAAVLMAGGRLITDDLLVLKSCDHRLCALPGARRLKLDPKTARQLGFPFNCAPMDDGSGKAVFDVPPESFVADPVPLDVLIVLRPFADRARLDPVDPLRAVREVLSATFNPLEPNALRLHKLLGNARNIAASLPFYDLALPRDIDSLQQAIGLLRPN